MATKLPYISVKDASKQSDYTADYISQLCKEGDLQCDHSAGLWLVSVESLQEYLNEHNKDININLEDASPVFFLSEAIDGTVKFFIKNDEYVDSDTASSIAGMSKATISSWAKEGMVEAVKISRVWFVKKSDLRKMQNDTPAPKNVGTLKYITEQVEDPFIDKPDTDGTPENKNDQFANTEVDVVPIKKVYNLMTDEDTGAKQHTVDKDFAEKKIKNIADKNTMRGNKDNGSDDMRLYDGDPAGVQVIDINLSDELAGQQKPLNKKTSFNLKQTDKQYFSVFVKFTWVINFILAFSLLTYAIAIKYGYLEQPVGFLQTVEIFSN